MYEVTQESNREPLLLGIYWWGQHTSVESGSKSMLALDLGTEDSVWIPLGRKLLRFSSSSVNHRCSSKMRLSSAESHGNRHSALTGEFGSQMFLRWGLYDERGTFWVGWYSQKIFQAHKCFFKMYYRFLAFSILKRKKNLVLRVTDGAESRENCTNILVHLP